MREASDGSASGQEQDAGWLRGWRLESEFWMPPKPILGILLAPVRTLPRVSPSFIQDARRVGGEAWNAVLRYLDFVRRLPGATNWFCVR